MVTLVGAALAFVAAAGVATGGVNSPNNERCLSMNRFVSALRPSFIA
jgi:hypothetical protein